MNRRGFLGSIVGAAVAGPSAVKSAAAKAGLGKAVASLGGAVASGVVGNSYEGIYPVATPSTIAANILEMIRGEDYFAQDARERRNRGSVAPLKSVSETYKSMIILRMEHEDRIAGAVRTFARKHPVLFSTVTSEEQIISVLENLAKKGD